MQKIQVFSKKIIKKKMKAGFCHNIFNEEGNHFKFVLGKSKRIRKKT